MPGPKGNLMDKVGIAWCRSKSVTRACSAHNCASDGGGIRAAELSYSIARDHGEIRVQEHRQDAPLPCELL